MKDRICILSSQKYLNKIQEDLMLQKEFSKDYDCDIVAWETLNKNNIGGYSAYVIKSVWGFNKDYSNFLELLKIIDSAKIPIFNSYKTVIFDISKKNQIKFLNDNGIPTIKTAFLSNYPGKDKKYDENDLLVTKPAISESGNDTRIITVKEIDNLREIYSEILEHREQDILIQPFKKEVEKGEISCIIVDDKIQYTVRRYPGVLTKEKKVEYIPKISYKVYEFVQPIIDMLKKYCALFYRIDLLETTEGFLVMELEMIDPDLFIRDVPDNIQKTTLNVIKKLFDVRLLEKGKTE